MRGRSVLVLWLATWASPAAAQPACPEALGEWLARCEGAGAEAVSCPAGHVIVGVRGGLRVDVTGSPGRAFARAGPLGLAPVGRFESWQAVPADSRAGFEALVACARAEPAPLQAALERPTPPEPPRTRALAPRTEASLPWRLALGVLLIALLAVERAGVRGALRGAGWLALAALVLLVARALLVPDTYFHQNGQGPFWVSLALGAPSSYGPGYAELFQAVARWTGDDPERGLLALQGVLAAFVPALAVWLARASARDARLAAVFGLVVALSPTLARLARSESYHATCGALIVLAAAVLATFAAPEAHARTRVLASVAAGLVLAQAARVHPVAWVPCALAPLVVLVGAGEAKARLRATLFAAGIIAAVVAITTGPALLEVLQGSLGEHWRGELGDRGRHSGGPPAWVTATGLVALTGLVAALGSAAYRRVGLALAVLAATLLVAWGADILDPTLRGVHAAYASLHLAPALAALAALTDEAHAGWPRLGVRGLAAGVLIAALGVHALTARDALVASTDAREAMLLRSWRTRLPADASVFHLARAGQHVASLPLYDARSAPVRADEQPLPRPQGYLLRTSLCSTAAGREACAALERDVRLEPIETATLPALPSVGNLPYDGATVEIGLYRVLPR
jgi:hypothetical protein